MSVVERKRIQLSKSTRPAKKALLGQFLTPGSIAKYMANLFTDWTDDCYLLDAGAGIGSLSAAFLDKWNTGGFSCRKVVVDAFEIDRAMAKHLVETLNSYSISNAYSYNIYQHDFILTASALLKEGHHASISKRYTHVILNPPYKKINSSSAHRLALRRVGIETVNLYSAFVALSVLLTTIGGQIVAIIPRSFCNGPYYRPFRDFILEHTAIKHIHLFESRNQAFKDDNVLQENIIIHLEKGGKQGPVTVTTSTDDSFADLVMREHPFERIVPPDDPNRFIYIPTSQKSNGIEHFTKLRYKLDDLGLSASTGPVVDFRLKEHLRNMPEKNTVPLLYPIHFRNNVIRWPISGIKKPNAIMRNSATEKWLYPNGFYCVVRRFSSKEERRRIKASVVEPSVFGSAPMLGFENHLNVLHENKHGMQELLARGLAVFLNSSIVDEYFRLFNGHTQVNVTDLKQMMYPSREILVELGKWAMQQKTLEQNGIDTIVEDLTK